MAEKTRNRRSKKEILISSLSELDSKIQKEEETLEKLKAQRAAFQKELAEIRTAEEKAAEEKAAEEKAYKNLLATMKKQGITAQEVMTLLEEKKEAE